MRLREVRVENFGVFKQRRFDLGGDGLVLVHGPNEAGKSTLLQLLRELLFGFPHSSPYAFDGAGAMSADAISVLADGRELAFTRRKGRTGVVKGTVGADRAAVDEQRLSQLLSHAKESLYRNVFAFSLTELSAGVDSLKSAELTDALFGGGLGGLANLQRIRAELAREHEELFKPSARKPPINHLIGQIKQHRADLQKAAVKPKEYVERQQALAKLEGDLARLKTTHADLATELAHLHRLSRAWEHWCRWQSVREELDQLQIPESFHLSDAATFRELEDRLAELATERDKLSLARQQTERELTALACHPELVARAAEINALAHEIGKVEGYLRDLPQRQAEHDALREKMLASLHSLHPDWGLDRLAKLQLTADQRQKVRDLAAKSHELASAQQQNAEAIADLQSRLATQQTRLGGLEPPVDASALGLALRGEGEYSSQRKEVRRAAADESRLTSEMQDLAERLAAIASGPTDLSALRPPLGAAVEEFARELDGAAQQMTTVAGQVEHCQDDVAAFERQLATLEAAGQVPDFEQLRTVRQHRDQGWSLIRRQYLEGIASQPQIDAWLGQEKASPAQLGNAFSQSVQAADQLADERQRQSDLVAQKESLLRQRRQAQDALAKSQARQQALTQAHAAILARWHALWEPCGLIPASPEVMQDWLRYWESYQDKSRQRDEARRGSEEAEKACAAFEFALRQTTGDETTPIDRILHNARTRIAEANRQQGMRETLLQGLEENKVLLANHQTQTREFERQQSAWQKEWRSLLAELALPVDWKVESIELLLQMLEQIFRDEREADSLAERIAIMTQERDQFDSASQKLAVEVAPGCAPLPMVVRAGQMAEALAAAQQALTGAQSLQRELARLADEAAAREKQFQERSGRRAELLKAAGAADDSEFRRLAQAAQHREQLRKTMAESELAVRVAREAEDADVFEQSLRKLDLSAVQARQAELAQEAEGLKQQIDDLLVESGKQRTDLARLHEEGESLRLQQSIERDRGHLAEHVDRCASLLLAEKLLEDAIERFQREHQPQVLSAARALLSQLTGGTHVDIRQVSGDSFWIVDRQGQERRPEQLSRGTQEQLYLAFRLAYVQHYCRDNEPLPLVMDDVLVNFDQNRAALTLSALHDLSSQMQIIFLTCHDPTAALVQQHCADCHILKLSSAAQPSS